jgi:hypothetical protein
LICVREIAYHSDNVQGTPDVNKDMFIAMEVYVENLSTFEIFVDPGKFTLKLANGSFAYYVGVPENIPQNENLLEYTTMAPGKSTEGMLYISVSNFISPESLTYRGYIFESTLSIELIDHP